MLVSTAEVICSISPQPHAAKLAPTNCFQHTDPVRRNIRVVLEIRRMVISKRDRKNESIIAEGQYKIEAEAIVTRSDNQRSSSTSNRTCIILPCQPALQICGSVSALAQFASWTSGDFQHGQNPVSHEGNIQWGIRIPVSICSGICAKMDELAERETKRGLHSS